MNKLINEKFYKDLFNYIPYNDKEIEDKRVMLEYIKNNDDCLFRSNLIGHITCSAFILNKEHNKALMIYHNIFDSWAIPGGHADGDSDLLNVAIKEAKEETGIINIKPIINDIFTIEVISLNGHYKNNKYVSSHLHFNFSYLLEASESDILHIKEDENKGVKWIDIDEIMNYSTEEWFKNNVYNKMIQKKKLFV